MEIWYLNLYSELIQMEFISCWTKVYSRMVVNIKMQNNVAI